MSVALVTFAERGIYTNIILIMQIPLNEVYLRYSFSSNSLSSRFQTATGKFNIKDLKFNYPTRPHVEVLHGLDLKVEAGKTVALVGSSGCGKSTILQLMQRFYDPLSGNIVRIYLLQTNY